MTINSLQDLLNSYREAARTERDKGTYFERLSIAYLTNDPVQVEQYEDVKPYAAWAIEQGWDGRDTGIDLVAKLKDEDTVLLASEPGMLRWLAARNNIKIESTFEPKANLHVKFHIKNANVSEFEFEQLEVKDNYPSYNPPAKRTPAGGSTGVGTGSAAGAPSSVPEKAVIRDINLDKTKTYEVFGFRFEAYAVGGEYGKCIAYLVEDPFLQVHIRSITKEIYQNQYEDNCFKVKITDIKCPSGNYWEAFAIGHKYNQSIAKADDADDKVDNAADHEAVYNGPAGNFVTKVQMLDLVKDGCMMCHSGISLAEFDFIDWVDGKPVCPDCIEKCTEMMEA